MKKLLAILSLSLLLMGCQDKNVIYKDFQSLGEEYEWAKSEKKTFVIDIKENKTPKQLVLAFRCATGYAYDKALIQITETDPSGKEVRRDVELKVRDEKGEFLGEKGYDIIDLEMVLDENKTFPTFGKYTYVIEQAMADIDPLNYALEVGLILKQPEGQQ